jgi:DNA primase
MTAIDEIKNRVDIVDLVSETVTLRRAGKNYTGFCPFHANTRTPAFVVFPDSGTWRCFGECNEGGDIFRFVMKKEGVDFAEALRMLADRAGVKLEPVTPQKKEEEETHQRLRDLLEEAVIFYRHHLLHHPAAQEAQNYLQKRGLKPETMESFGIGYAPPGWDTTLQHFTAKGYTAEDLVNAGLVVEKQEGGGVYDRFRHRILFPIREMNGKMAGFGARRLNPEDEPKFLNSPQTELFDKGRLLYGLDAARKAIRAKDQAIIVEGYMDVVVPHQEGFTNVVSPMGTALTEAQLHLLKRFSKRIILALDADAAGEKATLRGLEVARQTLDRTEEISFDPRGLLRHEARLQADLRVTTLPPGMDPDEVVLRDPQEWQQLVDAAKPIVVHVMETLAAAHDLDDPKAKAEVAGQVLPLIEDVANPVERDAYRQRLARLLRVDERSLLTSQPARQRPQQRRSTTRPDATPTVKETIAVDSNRLLIHRLETEFLRLLLRNPDLLNNLDRYLQSHTLNRVTLQEFDHADHQGLLRLIQQSLEQIQADPKQYIHENVPPELRELLTKYLEPLPLGEPTENRLGEDLARTLLRLRKTRIMEQLAQIRQMQQDLQEQGETGLQPYRELVLQYTLTGSRLDLALSKPVLLE